MMSVNQLETCWYALVASPSSSQVVAAMAALRLDLISMVGEAEQKELIAKWNSRAAMKVTIRKILHRLAQDGIAWQFVEAGMPVAWVNRLSYLFQYMGLEASAEPEELLRERMRDNDDVWAHVRARSAGTELLARAILKGDATAIEALSKEVLDILKSWKNSTSHWTQEREIEEQLWVASHAAELAEWGTRVSNHLQFISR